MRCQQRWGHQLRFAATLSYRACRYALPASRRRSQRDRAQPLHSSSHSRTWEGVLQHQLLLGAALTTVRWAPATCVCPTCPNLPSGPHCTTARGRPSWATPFSSPPTCATLPSCRAAGQQQQTLALQRRGRRNLPLGSGRSSRRLGEQTWRNSCAAATPTAAHCTRKGRWVGWQGPLLRPVGQRKTGRPPPLGRHPCNYLPMPAAALSMLCSRGIATRAQRWDGYGQHPQLMCTAGAVAKCSQPGRQVCSTWRPVHKGAAQPCPAAPLPPLDCLVYAGLCVQRLRSLCSQAWWRHGPSLARRA